FKLLNFFFFFFFQAEDGIRVLIVTGVQTCALPICPSFAASCSEWERSWRSAPATATRLERSGIGGRPDRDRLGHARRNRSRSRRSEERRVGKECRSLCWP